MIVSNVVTLFAEIMPLICGSSLKKASAVTVLAKVRKLSFTGRVRRFVFFLNFKR